MTQEERLSYLIDFYLSENISTSLGPMPSGYQEQKSYLRGLMNQRPPSPVPEGILAMEDAFLLEEMGQETLPLSALKPIRPHIYLWQGDITTLAVDAIVNAGNSALLGCFLPNHSCIDNIIHTKAGVRLRLACHQMMEKQGHPEPVGKAKITPGFNLPCRYVIHTVGPMVNTPLEDHHRESLVECYQSCLNLALEKKLKSIAFCCISTGEFHFPPKEACRLAVETVEKFLKRNPKSLEVIFNVFQDSDLQLYTDRLG